MQTSDWIRAVAAVGTWAAVVVALFGEFIRRWLKRPRLRVVVENEAPRCLMSTLGNPQTGPSPGSPRLAYYLRLWVENEGKSPAEEVEVVANRLFQKRADDTFEEVRSFHPMNLMWAYIGKPFAPRIAPGMGRHCDLGRVVDPAIRGQTGPNTNLPQVPSHLPILDLAVEARVNSLPHLLAPGTYRLQLVVAASNAKPVSQTVAITITAWNADEDEMRRHGVRMSPSSPP